MKDVNRYRPNRSKNDSEVQLFYSNIKADIHHLQDSVIQNLLGVEGYFKSGKGKTVSSISA